MSMQLDDPYCCKPVLLFLWSWLVLSLRTGPLAFLRLAELLVCTAVQTRMQAHAHQSGVAHRVIPGPLPSLAKYVLCSAP